jgi:hypothetical protein
MTDNDDFNCGPRVAGDALSAPVAFRPFRSRRPEERIKRFQLLNAKSKVVDLNQSETKELEKLREELRAYFDSEDRMNEIWRKWCVVGPWLIAATFIAAVVTALAYGASR